MKHLRSVIAIVLTLSMILTFIACSGSDSDKIKGGVYTKENGTVKYENSDIGATAVFDSDWYVAEESELASLMEIVADNMSDDDIAKLMRESDTFFDLYAMSNDGTGSINITYEKLSAIYGVILDENGYVDASMENLDSNLSASGFYNITKSKTTTKLAGKDHVSIELKAMLSGVQVYEKLVCVKAGGYMVCITVATYLEDNTDDLIAMFK